MGMARPQTFNITEADLIAFLAVHLRAGESGVTLSRDIRRAAILLAPAAPSVVAERMGGYRTIARWMRQRYGIKARMHGYYNADGKRATSKAYHGVRLSDAAINALATAG